MQCVSAARKPGGESMDIKITDTITAVDEEEWTSLAGHHKIEQSYSWFKTAEDSGIRKIHYVFVREHTTLTAAACCYPFKEKMYMELPLLEVKSPLGISSAFYLKTPAHAEMLIKGLEEIRQTEQTKGYLILDLTEEESTPIKKHLKGFTDFRTRDNTYIDLDFTDFKDYLSSLTRKRRKSIKHTLNRAQKKWGITSLFTNEFSQWKSVCHRLQKCMCDHHNDYRWLLNEQFYEALEHNMKENAELLLFFKDSTPILSVLSFNTPEIAQYRFPGIDPEYKEYQAYFLLYYEGIKRAIEKRQKRIYFGPTTYEFKEKIGCEREKLFGFAKMTNPVLNLALKSYVTVSTLTGKKF